MTNRKVAGSWQRRNLDVVLGDDSDEEGQMFEMGPRKVEMRSSDHQHTVVSYTHPILHFDPSTIVDHSPSSPSPCSVKSFDELFEEWMTEDLTFLPSSPPSELDDLFKVDGRQEVSASAKEVWKGADSERMGAEEVERGWRPESLSAAGARLLSAHLRFEEIKARTKRRKLNPPPPPPIIIFTPPSPVLGAFTLADTPPTGSSITITPSLLQPVPWVPARSPRRGKRSSVQPTRRGRARTRATPAAAAPPPPQSASVQDTDQVWPVSIPLPTFAARRDDDAKMVGDAFDEWFC